MTYRKPTYGNTVTYNNTKKEMIQIRPLNPPSCNARFQKRLRDENPEYTLVEEWKNV